MKVEWNGPSDEVIITVGEIWITLDITQAYALKAGLEKSLDDRKEFSMEYEKWEIQRREDDWEIDPPDWESLVEYEHDSCDEDEDEDTDIPF